jgi:pimeloyl-ACP methyl ester carboxylesterase
MTRRVRERRILRAPGLAALLAIGGLALVALGCATPVGTKFIDPQAAYRLQYVNALAVEQPSEASKAVLRRLGLLDRFEDEPSKVLAELHRGLSPAGDEDRLYALAELSFLQAARTGDRGYFLASAVYAYALLFPGQGASVQLNRADPRGRLAYDFYNQGLARGLTAPREQAEPAAASVTSASSDEVRLVPGTRTLPFGTLVIDLDPSGLTWAGYRLERFVPTTTLEVRGLRNRYWHPGLGASLAANLAPEASARVIGAERIGPRTKVPVTVLLRLENARASLATGLVRGRLEVYSVDLTSTVTVDGQAQPLEFDTTAPLAYQLEGSPIYDVEIAGFLRGGALGRLKARDRAEDGLALLWPYRPGKIPVVLVHGTASSPARWAELFNELIGDPRIRERYQFWIFIYDSGNPIGYSAGRLRAALAAAVKELDPEGKDPALRRMVVIGHSQGGLLTKLTAIDSGTRFWDAVTKKPFDSIKFDAKVRELLQQSMFFTPLPFVERVIFISTPHRGALLATGRLGAIAAWLVTLPTGLGSQLMQAVTETGDEALARELRRPPTAIDNMSPGNRAIKTLSSIPVPPTVKAHSIIAVKGDGPVEEGDDGVVAYRSAHIDEAVSQVVVRWGHSVQDQPQAIEEVRRILLEHAAAPAGDRR